MKRKLRKAKKDNKYTKWLLRVFYIYRYDIFAITISLAFIALYMDVLFKPGLVVFSDIDFPFNSKSYLEEIIGLWNNKWNTTSMLNIPRLLIIMPTYLVSILFDYKGSSFFKLFVFQQLVTAMIAMYYLSKEMIIIYNGKKFDLYKILALIFGSLLYALNPYVIFRIQHIYLLVGYSLFPLIIVQFLRIFDHKFLSLKIRGFNPYHRKLYKENYRDIFILAYLITVASAAIHYFFYAFIVLAIMFFLLMIKYTIKYFKIDKTRMLAVWKNQLKKLTLLVFIFLGLSFYWLSIYIGSIILDVAATQHNINVIDTYTMFSRHASFDKVAYMMSYWWPMFELSKLGSSFYLSGGLLGMIILVGIIFNTAKKHLISLITFLGFVTFLLSTGVNYDYIGRVFLVLCELPIFGNVFRDPNKFVGLTAVSYSILLTFGMESMVTFAKDKKIIKNVTFLVVGIAMVFYLLPMRELFINRYYVPVEEPVEYVDLRDYYSQSNKADEYAIYFPVAESMMRPIYNRTTPKWNVVDEVDTIKATGDIHVYSTPVKTLFHHEGNDPSISYYLSFLQNLLDQGRSEFLSNYIQLLGGTDLVYHSEYLDMEARQAFNLQVLDNQRGMEKSYANPIFNVYDLQKNTAYRDSKQTKDKTIIWTPYGLSKFELYFRLDNYDVNNQAVVFTQQKKTSEYDLIDKNDLVDSHQFDEFYLSLIPEKYISYPFNWVDEVNAFLKWSKTYTSNYDWSWYLNSQNIDHRKFEFDNEGGVAVTFASGKLNVTPDKKDSIVGKKVIDFDTMLRTDSFFIADNPEIFDIKPNPYNDTSSVGNIQGVLKKGDPNNIWQVGKSKMIRAQENTPYNFNVVISGRNVNKMHVKVRFFDASYEPVGVQYVVAPEEVVDFETVNFKGESISPKNTKFMRLELLSFQRPKTKSYWWVHDVNVYDLSDFKTDNVISTDYNIERSGQYNIYLKTYKSEVGGYFDLTLGEYQWRLKTEAAQVDQFVWQYVGSKGFEEGQYPLMLENIDGFNAVNQVLIIPDDFDKLFRKQVASKLMSVRQLISFEGESGFFYSGNIQSKRTYNTLSSGRGLGVDKGSFAKKIQLFGEGYYKITSPVYSSNTKGSAIVSLTNEKNEIVYESKDNIEYEAAINGGMIGDYDPLERGYAFKKLDIDNPYTYLSKVEDTIYLNQGMYKLNYQIDSQATNLAGIESLRKFDPNELIVKKTLEDVISQTCSECEKITFDMFRSKMQNDLLEIEYDPTCSCDWYIYTSPSIDVKPLEELLVTFDAKSSNLLRRHTKMVFLDDYNHVLDTQFIFEVAEDKKLKWNHYEQLVKVPSNAKKVMFQVWGRGNKTLTSTMTLKNLSIKRYNEFKLLDYVTIEEQNAETVSVDEKLIMREINKSRMSFSKEIDNFHNEFLWNSYLSPNKIWRVNGSEYEYVLNGVTMGFLVEEAVIEGQVVLGKIYYMGLILHFLTFIVIFMTVGYMYIYRR